MIAFSSQKSEARFREASSRIHGVNSLDRVCRKCGEKRPQSELIRQNYRNTRLAPTRWICKGGCDVR